MAIPQLAVLDNLKDCSDPDAEERLALGKALLAIKEQRLYRQLGHQRFESFLDSETCPFGHTCARHAMRLAERTDLHGVLSLGIGRLTELMRLQPAQATRLLQEGTPAGTVEQLSVRMLRAEIARIQGRPLIKHGSESSSPGVEQWGALVEHWSGSVREQLLSFLLEKQYGQDLGKIQGLLAQGRCPNDAQGVPLSTDHATFSPDTRRSVPQRWVALTMHLEQVERREGRDPATIAQLVRRLHQPIEAWERAVFYLDLCRRDTVRWEHYAHVPACQAIEKMLAGRDWHYNTDQDFLAARLARVKAGSKQPATVRPFWRRLFNEVSPPAEYRQFLGQLPAQIIDGEWQITCTDPYQAEFTLGCLRHRTARLFWQIAADELGINTVRLYWPEGGRKREQLVQLQAQAA